MNDLSYNTFKKKIENSKKIFHVNSLQQLNELLLSFEPTKCNFVGYIFHEYGYIEYILKHRCKEFFDLNINNGKIIGSCLPGQEFFYRDVVDILIVLDNFFDAENSIKNGEWTNNWNIFLQRITKDKGLAFWGVGKNFNELEFSNIIKNLNFKNVLWSQYYGHGRSNGDWHYKNALGDTNLGVNTIMSTGQKKLFLPKYKNGHVMVNEYAINHTHKKLNYPVFFKDCYYGMFLRNCHKENIRPLKNNIVECIFKTCIEKKKHLIVFNDIKQFDDIPKNKYIHEIQSKNRATFPNYIDVDKIIYYMYNCKGYFCYGTSIGDIIRHHCNTDLYLIPEHDGENNWIKRSKSWLSNSNIFQKKKGKKIIEIIKKEDINDIIN